jgi:8-oxo-dGTP diphosphatase
VGFVVGKRKWTYDWPRPAVTVDLLLFTVAGALQDLRLQVLLIERNLEPFRGSWAIPGGFVRANEDLYDAALRELTEETGIREVYLEQVEAVGTPGRDPRGHVVTVLYVALVAADRHRLAPTQDAASARWFDVAGPTPLPPLAFDHADLLRKGLEHLRRRLDEAPICFELLPKEFALSELQALHEAILGRPLDRRNFRRRILQLGFLARAKSTWRHGRHRPAQLYAFVPEAFAEYTSRRRGVRPS